MLRPGGLKTLTDALKNLLTTDEHSFYYSGNEDGPREFGTDFIVIGKARDAVIGFSPVEERFCSLRMRSKFFNYTLINVHASTEEKDEDIY